MDETRAAVKHTMDYETFKEKFVENLKDKLYEQGAEVNVSVHNVNKLNESYEAVTVTPEGSNIGVNIPIDKFYDAIESGKTYDEVVDKAVDVVTNGISQRPDFDIDSLSDYSQMKGAGYERWAKVFNVKQVAKALLFLEEHDIRDLETLNQRAKEAADHFNELSTTIKSAEKRMAEISVLRTHILNYVKTKDVYVAYRKSGYRKAFFEAHREEITLHKAAK